MSHYVDNSQFVNPHEGRPKDMQQQPGGRRHHQESGVVFDGKRIRAAVIRKPIDYTHSITTELEERIYQPFEQKQFYVPPHTNFQHQLYPPSCTTNHSWDILTHFAHASTNKIRTQINAVSWTPEGRRLISGSAQGEFTLWNGMAFNFETIQQAHDEAVRSIVWTHNGNFMVSCDNKGEIKYWQSNMNNLKAFKGHDMMIRDLSFSPTDKKFVSCSDDASMKIWDFETCQSERILRGHGSDVRCCDWHPFNSLIVSGGKDSLVKIFDAKSEKEIATLYGHKQIVNRTKWNRNGNWILTCAKDQLIKVFDIRFMKEASYTFRGHKKDISSIAWHPTHERLFASGGYEGELIYWVIGSEEPQARIMAHEAAIWDLKFHPLGHVLCTGSHDFTVKFWSRNKPGDKMKDKYNSTQLPPGIQVEFVEEKIETGENGEPQQVISGIKRDHEYIEEEPYEEENPSKITKVDTQQHGGGSTLDEFNRFAAQQRRDKNKY